LKHTPPCTGAWSATFDSPDWAVLCGPWRQETKWVGGVSAAESGSPPTIGPVPSDESSKCRRRRRKSKICGEERRDCCVATDFRALHAVLTRSRLPAHLNYYLSREMRENILSARHSKAKVSTPSGGGRVIDTTPTLPVV
jgi:hypothetical protein